MSIHRASHHEEPLLTALRREAILGVRPQLPQAELALWLALDPWRGPPAGAASLAAYQGGSLSGAALLVRDTLLALYVLPACQGSGLGSALLRAAEAELQRTGYPCLRLHAAPSALGFYRRHGYRRGQRLTRWFSGPGGSAPVALTSVLLWRDLAVAAIPSEMPVLGSPDHGSREFA